MIEKDLDRLGKPLTRTQIILRELRAVEHFIRRGGDRASLTRRAEKLRKRLEAERNHGETTV
jgi:hypothetical protein